MRIEYYYPEGAAGCCPAHFYAIIFNRSHQALKPNAGVLEFATFSAASQGDFDIPLAEHAQRTRFYYTTIADADISLPASAIGQKYTMEIWKTASAGNPNRTNDTLRTTREFMWNGTEFIDAELGAAQLLQLAMKDVFIAVAYDSSEMKLRCMAYYEKNGELQTDPLACSFSFISRGDTELINSSPATQLANAPGIFAWEQSAVSLDPDEVYAAVVTITDADGIEHTGVSAQVTWD